LLVNIIIITFDFSTMPGKVVLAKTIAVPFMKEVEEGIRSLPSPPTLVAFLANNDPNAKQYALSTQTFCESLGIHFQLRECDREDLEEHLIEANQDATVDGIMVYYPVFNDRQDQYLQNVITFDKDVEALSHTYLYNLYHNMRTLPSLPPLLLPPQKSLVPCTPLAIVKTLEYLSVYNLILPYGNRCHGRTITIVNRSEVVGRPLAAMLANDGARVFSVDVNGVVEFHRGPGIKLSRHTVTEVQLKLDDVLPQSDVVISAVPSIHFRIPTEKLKEGVIAINVASEKNFSDDVKEKASLYVPSVGKVTITMLLRNLVRLAKHKRDAAVSATTLKTKLEDGVEIV